MVITRPDGVRLPDADGRRAWLLLAGGVLGLLLAGTATMVAFLMSYGDPGPDAPYTPPPGWVAPLFWAGTVVGVAGVAALAGGGTLAARAAARRAALAAYQQDGPRTLPERVVAPDGTVWFRDGLMWWPGRSADDRQVFDGLSWGAAPGERRQGLLWSLTAVLAWVALRVLMYATTARTADLAPEDRPDLATALVEAAVIAPFVVVVVLVGFSTARRRPPFGPADGRQWVWTAPPGWPTPPDGFFPQPHWRPDPDWPNPPADWRGWRLEPVDPGAR